MYEEGVNPGGPTNSARSIQDGIDKLAAALSKAQALFPEIPRTERVTVRTKTGGSYEFKYAPFEAIIAAIRKPLTDNGLAVIQTIDTFLGEKTNARIRTVLLHESGQRFSSGGTPVLNDGVGPQAYGSAITYAKRYDLSLTLGIATNDDDDGVGASGNTTQGKKPAATGGGQNGAEAGGVEVDQVFVAALQLAAKDGLESLRAAWLGGTPKQRKGLKDTLESLKIVAKGYDDARTSTDE